jgi:hypothetical protein
MADNVFPDSNDRTPNDPCVLLSWASVRRLYEKANGAQEDGGPVITTDAIKVFIHHQAAANDWDVVEFHGKQVLLKKILDVRHPGTSPKI